MLALACASHSPLMPNGPADDKTRQSVAEGFSKLGSFIEDFAPDLAIEFAPDHFNGFFYDLMPMFCIGLEAHSVGDWGTKAGPLRVPGQVAGPMAEHLVNKGFDVAVSHRMNVDHGFVQFWENTVGSASQIPVVPVFVNCAAPPLPTFKRARLLGEEIGRFAADLGNRVLIVASGGLSHDPPTPQLDEANGEVRERLIAGRNPPIEVRQAKEARILQIGEAAAKGDAGILPVSREWDERFLSQLAGQNLQSFDDLSMKEVVAEAGRGGPETLCWVAAMAAASAQGPLQTELYHYSDTQGWIAGMAILSGHNISEPGSQ
ncbi:3-carboxyethylcatechol 2,3-dioxygenase [Qipengyuania oceanensis]|uniref:3-carboxyethylcatechol 2,3-dioxygenase n=1 Tax=Qipengyuania oceanensis TaxID=1463597 RepID=A0A844YII1_9SPHN|nr:3-carboxyethylcatechol 2,3-dioxygenase [Qipengyuania oceanensis]MXO63941.1 3-carboxyethylcatechol 2,3-dioxygenase [Qipengyuania oceanensis]